MSRRLAGFRAARLRTRVAVVLALVALLAAAVIATAILAAPKPAPAVVPYPTVTGDLGEHLKQLQKSVQP